MDKDIVVAINAVIETLQGQYPDLVFEHEKKMLLTDMVSILSKTVIKTTEYELV
ncbi:MAG: hypothetical protein LBL41_00785 [Bifidobacteriaceae bacterium]|jgi:hypothetical protein|nr:hypothetical protein [Bifidobacteriaceae bacterium]